MNKLFKVFSILILAITSACDRNNNNGITETEAKKFSVKNFNALINFLPESNNHVKQIDLNFENSFITGFVIPSANQTPNGNFNFSFEVKNKLSSPLKLYYKIYYQNESYKFPEIDSVTKKMHELCYENFYGSWQNTDITFKEVNLNSNSEFKLITDSFSISGNPRNEKKYFENEKNDRWKRNPRTGAYKFMLVVTDENTLKSNIPDYISNISNTKDNKFINPFYYFRYDQLSKADNLIVVEALDTLKVISKPNLTKGIYVDKGFFEQINDSSNYCSTCNQSNQLYANAPFAQFRNHIDPSMRFENIPVITDMVNGSYSKLDYNYNRAYYPREQLISTTPMIAQMPCKTVSCDSVKQKITLRNPATRFGEWRKESVGVISRHGMTYGKWRIKCKLTQLLNKENVWNGLTNAIWLIGQPGSTEWNNRRPCNKNGYMATYWGGPNDKRVPQVNYSEIDFEILKTPSYCPDRIFSPVYKVPKPNAKNIDDWNTPLPQEILDNDNKITVACTNWDMACWEPVNFGAGCNPITYEGVTRESHRWADHYRALTQKTYEVDDDLFATPYYYFEIDWRPTEIIWRIGASLDKMRIVGYMNDKVTSIPNNQMCLIVTQEFHNTKWWPGSPYQQMYIPFPEKDYVGEIYEFVIE